MNNTIRYCQLIAEINERSLHLKRLKGISSFTQQKFNEVHSLDIENLNTRCEELDALTAERNTLTGI